MQVHEAMNTARRRIKLRAAFDMASRCAMLVLIGQLAAGVWIYFRGGRVIESVWIGVGAGVIAVGFLIGWLRKNPTRFELAALIDGRLGLRERLSTAVSANEGTAQVHDENWKLAIDEQAAATAGRIHAVDLERAFSLPRMSRLLAAAAVMVLIAFLMPRLPIPGVAGAQGQSKEKSAEKKAEEARKAREAARRLESRAKEIAKSAENKKLEKARDAAMKVAEQAKKMEQKVEDKKDALSELQKIAKEIKKQKDESLGRAQAKDGLSKPGEEDSLSEMARQLDEARTGDLQNDFEKLASELRKEADAAKAEGRHPRVDKKSLEDLMKRLKQSEEVMRRLEELAKNDPAMREKLGRMSEEERKLLERIRKKLENLGGA